MLRYKFLSALVITAIFMLFLVSATNAQTWFWHRFQINYMTLLANIHGSSMSQYSAIVIKDKMNYNTCVLVLRDNNTGVLNMTSIHPSSCTTDLR